MSWLSNIATVLLAVAAAITPLGLYTDIGTVLKDDVPFQYVQDGSAIGRSTQVRSGYKTSRLCGTAWTIWKNCPGDDHGYEFISYPNGSVDVNIEDDDKKPYVSTKIARNISEVFESIGQASNIPDSVAGFFDIEYRSFMNWANKTPPVNWTWINKGQPFTQGVFRYYQPFILDSKVEAVEGLIVSMSTTPGVGFRNHTLPPWSAHGYTWSEDILWMEPETVCTDLNITLDFTIPEWNTFNNGLDAHITDKGGLAHNPVHFPKMDMTTSRKDSHLEQKSYGGAILTNALLIGFLNETQESLRLGKRYPLDDIPNCGYTQLTPNAVDLDTYGSGDKNTDFWSPNLPGALGLCTYSATNISASNDLANLCKHIKRESINVALSDSQSLGNIITDNYYPDIQNFSRTAVQAGLMQGAGEYTAFLPPRSGNHGDNFIAALQLDENGQTTPISIRNPTESATRWSQPFFSCASAIKASVKTVSFEISDEAVLANLKIRDVRPSNATNLTWAIENTGWDVMDINPLWGLVSEEAASHRGLSVFNTPEIYLPAGRSGADQGSLDSNDATAGISAPLAALANVYTLSSLEGFVSGVGSGPLYRGNYNWPLLLEWSRLSQNASTAGRIIDLIWTDLMANLVVGTKGPLYPNGALRPAAQHIAIVAYDWRYAALSLLFAGLYLAMLIATLLCYLFKQCTLENLRFMLNQTAAGRSVTTERYQAKSGVDLGKNAEWAPVRGDEPVLIAKQDARESSPHLMRLISREMARS